MKTSLHGVKEFTDLLSRLGRGFKIVAMRAIAEYIIGNERRGLKHEPKQKYVSRAKAYGNVSNDGAPAGYFSWNQFRYVATITNGFTKPYTRTHDISGGWIYTETNSDWSTVSVENNVEGAEFVYGGSRQTSLVGWRKVMDIISTNIKGAIQAGQKAVNDLIKSQS